MKTWRAKWIWLPDRPPTECNIYGQFRKTFDLEIVPNQALAEISADSRYMLYVNGEFVCRGVPMCDPLYQYYDEVDIAPYLKPGKNSIAVLVHHYGVSTSTYQYSGRAGLLFQARVGQQIIATNETWKSRFEEAYTQEVPRICGPHMLQGFQEHFDARKTADGWQETNFDDSDWKGSTVITYGANSTPPFDPWPSLVPRDIPHYFEEERPAARIVRLGQVDDSPLNEKNDLSAKMHAEPLRDTDAGFRNAGSMISWNDDCAVVTQEGDSCPSVILDFGKEVTGMLRLEVEGPAGAVVDIAVAELPTKEGINHWWGDLIGMGVAHRYVLRDGRQTFETFGRFGFRFAQLTFRNLAEPVKVHRVSVLFSSYDVGSRGSFECSDPLLNEIWRTGAYTTQCCMYDGWEDCPGREQRQWVGDARVEALINYACFGDMALTRKFLIQIGQSQRADGMTMMFYPGCCGIVNSTIVDYNLHWISAIEEYHLYSGDSEIVRELFPKVILSLRWWENRRNYDGLLENVPSHLYLDAAEPALDKRGCITVLNCFYVMALRSAANLATICGDTARAGDWELTAEVVSEAINDFLFDPEAGVYADCLHEGKLSERRSQHSNLLPMLLDIVPEDRLETMWAHITNEDHLSRTKHDVSAGKNVAAAQPFFSYFLFDTLARRGRQDIVLELTRRLWKPMIDAGRGTLWEIWHDHEEDVETGTQTSICHAWAASPTFFLSSEVLGFRPTSPGFRTFDVRPYLGDLSFARGVFPSVQGDIEVAWERRNGEFTLDLTVPKGATARVVLPDRQESQAGPGKHTFSAKV